MARRKRLVKSNNDDDDVARLLPNASVVYSRLVDDCVKELRATGRTSISLPSMKLSAQIRRSRLRRVLMVQGVTADRLAFESRTPLHWRPSPSDEQTMRLRLLVDLTQTLA